MADQGYGQQHDQQAPYSPDTAAAGSPPPPQAGQQALDGAGGKKKKRGYATQAFEFGAGGNAAAGGQTAGGIPPPPGVGATAGAPAYPGQQQDFQGGYPGAGVPAYGGAPAQPAYGAPGGVPAAPAVGGYQAPDAYYQGGAQGAPPGVSGVTAGMAGMNVGDPQAQQQQQQQQQPAQQGRVALNQLYPTDLLNQPFNVSELDLPPPPCILPPNVSHQGRNLEDHMQMLTSSLIVQRNAVTRCELPTQVHAIHDQCDPYPEFTSKEIETPVRSRHPALCCTTRYR